MLVIGCLVAFLHDLSDILALATKALSHTNYEKILATTFISCVLVWFYTRNIVFTHLTYKTAKDFTYEGKWSIHQPCVTLSVSMLIALVFLQWYWMSLFIKMLYGFVFKGEVEDIQNKTKIRDENVKKVKAS